MSYSAVSVARSPRLARQTSTPRLPTLTSMCVPACVCVGGGGERRSWGAGGGGNENVGGGGAKNIKILCCLPPPPPKNLDNLKNS